MRNVFGVAVLALVLAGPGALAKDKAAPSPQQVTPKEDETLTLKRGETKSFTFPGVTSVTNSILKVGNTILNIAGTGFIGIGITPTAPGTPPRLHA